MMGQDPLVKMCHSPGFSRAAVLLRGPEVVAVWSVQTAATETQVSHRLMIVKAKTNHGDDC